MKEIVQIVAGTLPGEYWPTSSSIRWAFTTIASGGAFCAMLGVSVALMRLQSVTA